MSGSPGGLILSDSRRLLDIVHAVVIMEATVSRGHNWGRISRYNWIGFRNMDVDESTAWMFVCMLGYTFIGFLFACYAKRRLRRDIF